MSWFARWESRRAPQDRTDPRETEKARYRPYLPRAEQHALVFPLIDATYDMWEGKVGPSRIAGLARTALLEGDARAWQNAAEWLARAAPDLPELDEMWTELASHPDWRIRWRVACLLYGTIAEAVSNRLFATLRGDRSGKVRDYAIERYEWRPDAQRVIERMLDASQFDARVRSGEVRL